MRTWLAATSVVLWTLVPAAQANETPVAGAPAPTRSVSLQTHDPAAGRVVDALLSDPSYWEGAWRKTYTGRSYDEIRLKEIDRGFLPLITGEGGADVPQAVIESVIFEHFVEMPEHLAKVFATPTEMEIAQVDELKQAVRDCDSAEDL